MTLIKSLKIRLLNWLLKDSFGALVLNDVISFEKKGQGFIIRLAGEPIDKQILSVIVAQAKSFHNTELWKFMTATLRAKAMETTSAKATEYEHVWAGKLLQYAITFQEEIISTLKKL